MSTIRTDRQQPDATLRSEDFEATTAREAVSKPARRTLRHSRFGSAHIGLIISAVVLVLLLIFILQNGHSIKVSFLGASGQMPLGVAMLFSAIAGALLIAIPGTVRILQLRRSARRGSRQPAPQGSASPAGQQ